MRLCGRALRKIMAGATEDTGKKVIILGGVVKLQLREVIIIVVRRIGGDPRP